MLSATWPYLAGAIASALAAGVFWWRSREAAGRWFAVFLAIEALHALAHGAPALTSDARLGQALINALHIPSFFGYVVGLAAVVAFTGIGRAVLRPWLIAVLLLGPIAMTVIELIQPSPFWVFDSAGVHALEGPLIGVSSVEGIVFLVFDVGFIALVTVALARVRDPADIPGFALLLAFLLVREVPVVADYLTNPIRFAFAREPSAWTILPDSTMYRAASVVVAAALILVALPWLRERRAKHVVVTGSALAAALGILVTVSGGHSMTALRNVFGAIILLYAALRHGMFGWERVAHPGVEQSLRAGGFAVLVVFVLASLQTAVGFAWAAPIAVTGGTALAGLFGVLSGPAPGAAMSGDRANRNVVGERYELRRRIGGTAKVFLARDLVARRDVAIKVVPSAAAVHEAGALGQIAHPNVMPLLDEVAVPGGRALVFPYLAAGSLADVLRAGPLDDAAVDQLGRDLLAALAHIHEAGLIHRDVKLANIYFDDRGRAVLGDLGSALADGDEGSAAYLSPARARGEAAKPADDVWAAAATLLEASTGKGLVEVAPGESAAQARSRVARGEIIKSRKMGPWYQQALAGARGQFPDGAAAAAAW